MDKTTYSAESVAAGNGVSYIVANDSLIAAGNKYSDQNMNFPLIMNLTNVVLYDG